MPGKSSEALLRVRIKNMGTQRKKILVNGFSKNFRTANKGTNPKSVPAIIKIKNRDELTDEDIVQSLFHFSKYAPKWFSSPKAAAVKTPTKGIKKKGAKVIEKKQATERSIKAHTALAYEELCVRLKTANTVNSLKTIAAANGLAGFHSLNKNDLCELIASYTGKD
jgi:hypothetical protein